MNLYSRYSLPRSPDDQGAAAPAQDQGTASPSPDVAVAAPASPPTDPPAGAALSGSEDAEPAVPQKSGAARRIDELTAEKWNERRAREAAETRAREAEATLEEFRRGGQTSDQGDPTGARRYTQADLERASVIQAQNMRFNEACNAAVSDGRKAHGDFDQSVEALKKIAGPTLPREFVEAALETGAAHEVLYRLGQDPTEADRILSLPPLRQAVALARYADKTVSAAKDAGTGAGSTVSGAPPPIKPRVASSTSRIDVPLDDPRADEIYDVREWIRRREVEVTAQRASRGR